MGRDVDVFFLGGEGEGKRNTRARLPRSFRRTTRVPNSPFMLYIIYCSVVFFSLQHVFRPREGGPRSSIALGSTFPVRLRQPVDLVHTLKTVKGLLLLVPPRTPRSSGYDVYAQSVYVVMCYMSLTCICRSLGRVVRVRLYS